MSKREQYKLWGKNLLTKGKEILITNQKVQGGLILGIVLFIFCVFVSNDAFLYTEPIMKITEVKTQFDHEQKGNYKETERYYVQTLDGVILNGPHKGQEVTFESRYAYSEIDSAKYRVHQKVFVHVTGVDSNLTVSITGVKRDGLLAVLFSILCIFLYTIMKRRWIFIILSVVINGGIYVVAIRFYENGTNIIWLANGMVVLFTVLTLLLVNGWNRKTRIAIVTSFITVILLVVILTTCTEQIEDMDYAFMEYVTRPKDLADLFLTQIMIGGLGAIMDVAVSMAASMEELWKQFEKVTIMPAIYNGLII